MTDDRFGELAQWHAGVGQIIRSIILKSNRVMNKITHCFVFILKLNMQNYAKS